MKYELLQPLFSLNDPVSGFEFASDDDGILIWFTDWRNRRVKMHFPTVYTFSYRLDDRLHDLPAGEAVEIVDSNNLKSLIANGIATVREDLHHYIISTNEGEWCEVLSERVEIDVEE